VWYYLTVGSDDELPAEDEKVIDIGPDHKWKGYEITPTERLAIVLRGSGVCAYCGENLFALAPRDVTIDHLTPRTLGGRNVAENLVPACRSCNSRKCHRPWRDYAPGGAQKRIVAQIALPLNLDLAAAFIRGEIETDEEVEGE
jgi:hypothetical protein